MRLILNHQRVKHFSGALGRNRTYKLRFRKTVVKLINKSCVLLPIIVTKVPNENETIVDNFATITISLISNSKNWIRFKLR